MTYILNTNIHDVKNIVQTKALRVPYGTQGCIKTVCSFETLMSTYKPSYTNVFNFNMTRYWIFYSFLEKVSHNVKLFIYLFIRLVFR